MKIMLKYIYIMKSIHICMCYCDRAGSKKAMILNEIVKSNTITPIRSLTGAIDRVS